MNYLTPFLHGGVYYVGVFLIVLTVLDAPFRFSRSRAG